MSNCFRSTPPWLGAEALSLDQVVGGVLACSREDLLGRALELRIHHLHCQAARLRNSGDDAKNCGRRVVKGVLIQTHERPKISLESQDVRDEALKMPRVPEDH